jgi:hypothetical protein
MVATPTGGFARPDQRTVQSNRSIHMPTPRYGSSDPAVGLDGGFAGSGKGAGGRVVVGAGRVVEVEATGSKVPTGTPLLVGAMVPCGATVAVWGGGEVVGETALEVGAGVT